MRCKLSSILLCLWLSLSLLHLRQLLIHPYMRREKRATQ